jgi:hypothetical protein
MANTWKIRIQNSMHTYLTKTTMAHDEAKSQTSKHPATRTVIIKYLIKVSA